jgi:DNA-binding NtrC family response regulator
MSNEEKTRILVLDDEPIVCKRLKPALEKAGYEVETYTRSANAIERVAAQTFDIVITDLKMEGVDGLQFLTQVKEQSPATEVIVITGFATMDTAKESYQKGVFDFIAKPFKLSAILEVVKKAEKRMKAAKA